MKSILHGKIYYNEEFLNQHVLVFDQRIKGIYSMEDYEKLKGDYMDQGRFFEELDGFGHYIIPGLIDVHIHGYKGVDVMDGHVASMKGLSKAIIENGVTAYLPTTMTMDRPHIEKALDTIAAVRDSEGESGHRGAMILGAHLEGPFINRNYKGAQPGNHIITGDVDWLNRYSDIIKVVTIAPEIEGNLELIKALSHKINFSLGHTGASFQEANEAFGSGAISTTHLFNAMTGLHHRKPGVVGAALTCDCYSELIADGLHVHPGLFSLLLKAKGKDRILLVSDCIRAGGLEEGIYDLGGQAVTVKNNQCLLPDGTIAGSVLKLNHGLKNFYENTNEELARLIPLVTSNQAKYLKVEKVMGTFDEHKYANITWLDEGIRVVKTMVKGKMVYES